MEEEMTKSSREIRPPTMLDALIPILSLIILLGGAIYLFGDEATSGGPTQVALMLCAVIAGLIGLKNGHSWADMGHAAVEGISTAMGAIFILLAVGALVGTWMMSGTIATLVHLGIQWLNPGLVLPGLCHYLCPAGLEYRQFLDGGRHLRRGLNRHCQRAGSIARNYRRCDNFWFLFWRQDVTPFGNHKSGTGRGWHGPIYPYQRHDVDGCALHPHCLRYICHHRIQHNTTSPSGSDRSLDNHRKRFLHWLTHPHSAAGGVNHVLQEGSRFSHDIDRRISGWVSGSYPAARGSD